jgi:tRNA 2-thiouridine synthesizing protein B
MLHTVNKSPFERNALEACLNRAASGAAILLYEDAVYAAMQGTSFADAMHGAASRFEVYALGPDLAARGVDPAKLVDGVRVVDYGGFVDLVAEKGPVQAWL